MSPSTVDLYTRRACDEVYNCWKIEATFSSSTGTPLTLGTCGAGRDTSRFTLNDTVHSVEIHMNTSHVFGPSSSTDALERWSSAKALFLPAGVVGAPPRSEGPRTVELGAVTSSFAGSRSAISPSKGTCVKLGPPCSDDIGMTKLHNFQPHQQHSHLSNSSTTFSPFNFINITSRFQTGDGLFSEARGQQNVAITSDMRRLICAAIDFWVRTSLPSPFSQIPRTLVPGPSVTTANGQLSAHGADDLHTNHRFSEDDLKIQEYKANFPQLHIPPIRQPKTARKQFDSLEQKTSEKNVLQSDFQSIRNELDTLKDELKEQIEYLLDKNPVENMGDTKALAQKLEELKIIHTKLLRDTIRAKVTELCAMHPHHTMIEITEMAGLPYTLDDIKQLVLESHMKDLHVLLHQVGSFQSKDGDRVLNWIASQLQDFIFKTVEFLYKYDMIPMSMGHVAMSTTSLSFGEATLSLNTHLYHIFGTCFMHLRS
ncbi:hypothetical protein PSTG_04161 [Puccinia striiformis f. sp. tritici PST-78]|uniref:Uncharacterized protein n=1 Tax=Puccinia striiformis f. sp. tritici PST-78 TaxID=1165861 RepID=A0A0L0VTF7_9BASI|nr:hypothetical protein PSTG_04161 [Puccinia striiformis f. sp. tritici PST-78]